MGFSGIECCLFGVIIGGEEDFIKLEERIQKMGCKKSVGKMRHSIYGPIKSERQRSINLLHVKHTENIENGDNNYMMTTYSPGDYANVDRVTTLNTIEVDFKSGDACHCALLLGHQLVREDTVDFVDFKEIAGIPTAFIKATKNDTNSWLVTVTMRCNERSDVSNTESQLLQLSSYLDEYFKLLL